LKNASEILLLIETVMLPCNVLVLCLKSWVEFNHLCSPYHSDNLAVSQTRSSRYGTVSM